MIKGATCKCKPVKEVTAPINCSLHFLLSDKEGNAGERY